MISMLVPPGATDATKPGCPLLTASVAIRVACGGEISMNVKAPMLKAASAADPIAKLRQNGRLRHRFSRGRRNRCDRIRQWAQALLPERDLRGEGLVVHEAPLHLASLDRAQHAEHILGRGELLAFRLQFVAVVGHRSRQSLSFIRPRLIQLFMVPSGTRMRSASSS